MGLVAIALRILGIGSEALALAQGLDWLIQREKNCTTEELFKRCFGHALKQRASQLAHYADPRDASVIAVDALGLDRAVASTKSYNVSIFPSDATQIARTLAPYFRGSIIIPNHQLTDAELDKETGDVLELAFSHFAVDLPAYPAAFRGVELSHVLGSALEHQQQQQMLQRLLALVEEIAKKQTTLQQDRPELSATMIQLESVRLEFRNPFRIVTAENFDHDYKLLAQLFMQPSDYDIIRSHDNLLISGGRGCGKSMVLKSMAATAAVEIERLHRGAAERILPVRLTFAESGLDYFGVYVKLFRGYFSEYTPDSKFTEAAAHVYFQHYFNCLLLRSLLESLKDAEKHGLLRLESHVERRIAEDVSGIAGWDVAELSLAGLSKKIRREESLVGQYMTRLRLSGESREYAGTYTQIDTFLRDCCSAITDAIPDLNSRRVYFLLDEFENLAEFQQKVVNTLAKLRPVSLSLKVATRAGGLKCNENLQGEAMQFPRDYQVVSLDYDVRSADYRTLLLEIGRRRLKAETFAVDDLTRLLEPAPKCHPATEEQIEAALVEVIKESGEDVKHLSPERIKEKRHQWADALVFRVSKNRFKPWTYAGFDSFVNLSSGIISNFMELCKMAFYMAAWEEMQIRGGQAVPWKIQNEAVYKTSQAFMEWIPRNIADTGPAISRLISDLGDIIRAKLLGHTSEPEAARIALRDPEALENPDNENLARIIDDAVRWSVLQTPGPAKAYLPKHRADVRPHNYYPNRILIPHLRISTNVRWTTEFYTADLARLIDERFRAAKRADLIRKHGLQRVSVATRGGTDEPSELELF